MSIMTEVEEAAAAELESAVLAVLVGKSKLTELAVDDKIGKYAAIHAEDLTPEQVNLVRDRIHAKLGITMDDGTVLRDDQYELWLEDARKTTNFKRAATYRQYLVGDEGFSPTVVTAMDELTDDLLELVGNPKKPGAWARRGLVLGDVQSGKTATYLGLFNKAIDAGYRLIIVLAGHTEHLRKQTQKRVDEGVIGRRTPTKPKKGSGAKLPGEIYVGIGKHDVDLAKKVQRLTSEWADFNAASQQGFSLHLEGMDNIPFIFVVKKNKSILENLHGWLADQAKDTGKLDFPLLLLDDESDYASVNTRDEDNPTVINELIRRLLDVFQRSSYLGFSATPFANIFIDSDVENDIYPRDYIYSLEAPSNYVGAERVFSPSEEIGISPTVHLFDSEDYFPAGHKVGHQVVGLPPSLNEALRVYLVANAIRDLRGQVDKKRSMLINVSRYVAVQEQVHQLVAGELLKLKNAVALHASSYAAGHPNEEVESIRAAFEKFYSDCEYSWSEVLDQLPAAVGGIVDRVINSKVDKKLEASESKLANPDRQVVVGGDVLSRGLTLEGLTVSYFYRHTAASDTLLQMARWFGYRPGYEDLCRVWITPEAADNFAFIDRSIKELRMDLIAMRDQGLTPRDFGLAVRKHPGSMLITARSKMKSATSVSSFSISYKGRAPETTKLAPVAAKGNFKALTKLLKVLTADHGHPKLGNKGGGSSLVWRQVDRAVVAAMLTDYKAHPMDFSFGPALAEHVRYKSQYDAWDVCVRQGSGGTLTVSDVNMKLIETNLEHQPGLIAVSGSKRRLAGSQDLKALIDGAAAQSAEESYLALNPKKKTAPEVVYLDHLERPALIIYPLGLSKFGSSEDANVEPPECPLVGLKIAYPGGIIDPDDTSEDVEYMITKVKLKELLGDDGWEDTESE
ncbi:Z1 domain-containing protein [Arthrobacter sp. FW305-BF8]|uniref:Z1 domain-containing protein n=1 Tax=Arthrobacter sp. FW305-BF8 TaxID=2879617 RepID=UPI001F258E17|nr:Z1 domain-containing protein [Arthrobacter sp. FW305-BF8]UKA55494.1 Z1 domain-containing protein [Arthrobacter sp. FW305-BF8]